MPQSLDRAKRVSAISQELDIALAWLRSGLAVLQENRVYHSSHFTFLLLLANGLERLMKLILVLQAEAATGQFHTIKQLRGLGHDLTTLRDTVVTHCFPDPSAAQADRDFLADDPLFQELLNILTVFAEQDRYLFLNSIAEPKKLWNPSDRLWEELGRKFFDPERHTALLISNQLELYQQEENRHFVIHLERCIRALTRLFASGVLGSFGRSFALTVQDFANLPDTQLGTRHYKL